MKNRSYGSEIEIKWSDRRDCVFKNVHKLKLPECDEKRNSRSRSPRFENNKRKSWMSNIDNVASYKKANRGVVLTKQAVAIATNVPTLTLNMTAEIEGRNKVDEKMTKFLKEVTIKECGTDGREYWPGNIKYNPILMQSIADENTYDCIKQNINVGKIHKQE